jgi:hypothetical protein
MTISSMIVSRDTQEVSVFECILGGLHMDVDVEPELKRAWDRINKSKVDALIVDCDLGGTGKFLRDLQHGSGEDAGPVVIVSGSAAEENLESTGAPFVVKKPVSVEQAVHTLSAARNMILKGRLRYHRQALDVPVSLVDAAGQRIKAHLLNLSQGGLRVRMVRLVPLRGTVEVGFGLPGSKLTLEAQGEVAWTDPQGNAGIRLLTMSEPMKRDLQLWLERQFFSPAEVRQ